jgi:exodeoxyribonuclease VII large subunit
MIDSYYSLSQITRSLQNMVAKNYHNEYWIKAEIAKLNYFPQSGHCYPDLVEKADGKVLAQIRATLWNRTYSYLQERFKKTTGRQIEDGMEILFRARLDYNPIYGLSLHISDIDPHFTLGKMASEKINTIKELKKAGVFFSNKALPSPLLPKRIAIISVDTSKGYQDFKNILDYNSRSYQFFHMLFPALLQGDDAVKSIGNQLERIRKVVHHFDLVAIIRGGGGDVGLNCYNHYDLALKVATFPLPVISGIGHSTNETVVEMVSHKNAITPTDLAYFLQQKFDNLAVSLKENQDRLQQAILQRIKHQIVSLQSLGQRIMHRQDLFIGHKEEQLIRLRNDLLKNSKRFIADQNKELMQKSRLLMHAPSRKMEKKIEQLSFSVNLLRKAAQHQSQLQWQNIHHLEDKIKLLDPVEVLNKGYSITRLNGKAITDSKKLQENDLIETQFAKGISKSIVKQVSTKK